MVRLVTRKGICPFFFYIFWFDTVKYGLEGALCSAIAYFIATKVIDVIQVGLHETKSVLIVSDNGKAIGKSIQARLGRGVTYSKAEGGFSDKPIDMVFCVITRLEESKLQRIVRELDPNAFVTISDVGEVKGGSFKKRDIH